MKEVKYKQVYKLLRNIKQVRQNLAASITVPKFHILQLLNNCIGRLAKLNGINTRSLYLWMCASLVGIT